MWFPTLSNSRLEPRSLRAGDYSSGILGRHCWLVPFRVPREAVRYFGVTTICSVSYWRFISGSGPIECNLGRPEQNGQYMQFVQRRINTGDCASR